MNVSDWPVDELMGLPDCVFGRRWVVSCEAEASDDAHGFDISEMSLPDRAVLWNVEVFGFSVDDPGCYMRLGLAQFVPATAAVMDSAKELVQDLGKQGTRPRRIYLNGSPCEFDIDLRNLVEAQGSKLVLEAYAPAGKNCKVLVAVTVSAIPREVPDWVFSGQAAGR